MSFDPELFMSTSVDAEMATKYDPVPEGEYTGVIKSVAIRNPKENMVILDVTWDIDDPALAERLGRESVTVRQSVFLDISDSGGIAVGPNKNVGLGRLREAVGQNNPGPWSPAMLEGAGPARITVEHRIDGENTYDGVKRVAKAA